jgi:hypothetical protein
MITVGFHITVKQRYLLDCQLTQLRMRVAVLFLLVIFLGLLSAYSQNSWQGYVFALIIFAVILPITILVHELGP